VFEVLVQGSGFAVLRSSFDERGSVRNHERRTSNSAPER
jgi:hypothetical protein